MTVVVKLEIYDMLTNAIVRIEKLVSSARHFVQKLCQNFSRYLLISLISLQFLFLVFFRGDQSTQRTTKRIPHRSTHVPNV
jgi:hypothetical protein